MWIRVTSRAVSKILSGGRFALSRLSLVSSGDGDTDSGEEQRLRFDFSFAIVAHIFLKSTGIDSRSKGVEIPVLLDEK